MLRFEFIHARSSPSYRNSDVGRARCRLSQAAFASLNIRVGWIVEWQICDGMRVLCTAWPDTSECLLEDNHACLDDAVYLCAPGDDGPLAASLVGSCVFLKAHAPRIGASVHVHSADGSRLKTKAHVFAAALSGLPLLTGFIVQASPRQGRPETLCIASAMQAGGAPCLAGLGTVIVHAKTFGTASCPASPASPAARVASKSDNSKNNDEDHSVDVGGTPSCCTSVVRDIIRILIRPSQCVPAALQVHGLLLLGPPGVGKTFAMRAVQRECASWCRVRICEVSISAVLTADNPIASLEELFSRGDDGNTDSNHADRSSKIDGAALPHVTVYVLDEVDALGRAGRNSDAQIMMKQYLYGWFDRQSRRNWSGSNEYVVATSNCADDVDVGFRRGGRLEKEIDVSMSPADREALLSSLLQNVVAAVPRDMEGHYDIALPIASAVSQRCGGYVAADLVALATEASRLLSSAMGSECDCAVVLQACVLQAMKTIKPAALRGATVQLSSLGYEDVIGHDDVKNSLRRMISFADPSVRKQASRFGVAAPGGALLYGPPGNSKTRLVMAVASHHSLPVIALSAADIYTPYVGDAEAEIRKAFRLARQCAPCILFLDEIDAIVTDRSNAGGSGGGVSVETRVLATLLTEMDGIDGAGPLGVFLLGATNRIDFIDAALLRKGRFHHLLHVPSPDRSTQEQLVDYFAARSELITPGEVVELKRNLAVGMSGADVENLIREEVMRQMHQVITKNQYK